MSKVLASRDKKFIINAGFRIDRIIHRRRRERDLQIKHINYVRNK